MRFFFPDFVVNAEFKRHTAGDMRQNNPKVMDDRDRISKIKLDMRDMQLQPLQKRRLIFLLGPRWNPTRPHDIKIVTKQYPTFTENYFKGMETIKELYWEALRAPNDPVNFRQNPYLRDVFKRKKLGRTRQERLAKKKALIKYTRNRKLAVRRKEKAAKIRGTGLKENLEQKIENAKQRRLLGFIDVEIDENGNAIPAEEGHGVKDKVMEDLHVRMSKYQQQVQETRERKKIEIVTPVAGIGKKEQADSVLRSGEYFQDV